MAKGKYKARKDNRDANQLSVDIAQAKAQLAQEQERLEQARADAGADAALRADLAAAIAARDAACAPQITRITGDRTAIKTATRELDALRAALATHIEKIDEWAMQSLGPEFYGAVVLGERFYFSKGVVSRNLDSQAVEDIQLAKGLRKHRSPAFSAEQQIRLGKVSAAAAGREAPDDLTGAQDASWDAFVNSFVTDMASLLAFQSPSPWLDSNCDHDHPVSRVLGAGITAPPITVSAANNIPSIAELSTATAALRDAVAAAGPPKAIDAVAPDVRHADYIASKSQIATSLTASPRTRHRPTQKRCIPGTPWPHWGHGVGTATTLVGASPSRPQPQCRSGCHRGTPSPTSTPNRCQARTSMTCDCRSQM